MSYEIVCEADSCYYNVNGLCEKTNGIKISFCGVCDSLTIPPPVDLSLQKIDDEH